MSIRVKSEELRRYFRNNGLVTDEAAQSIFNRINIELVTTTNGKVSQDLLDDLVLINATYPQLLRHTTIINTTGSEVDLQPIIDVLATYPNKSFDTLKSLTIRSKYDSDFNLDYSKLIDLDRLVLSGGNRVSKVTFDPKKLTVKHSPLKEFELELENFDLSGLDLNGSSVNSLKLTGRGTRNFSKAKGLELIKSFTVKNKDLDREFYDMVDFINSESSNIATLDLDGVNLSVERIFELLTSKKIAELGVRNSKITNVEGLSKWNGRLTALNLTNNDLKEKDIPELIRFMSENPDASVSFLGNTGINNLFNSLSVQEFSEHTKRNIYNVLRTFNGPREVKNKNVLHWIAEGKTIPISITDAEVIRGQAGLKLNPIEIPNGVNFETLDLDKDYLKGGTLLVSPAQIVELKKFGKLPKDMTLAVRITKANELSQDEIKRMYFEDGVSQVIMMNEDGLPNTRMPMKATDYYHLRGVLDEVVDGIDPNEPDIQKFMTVYTRLAENINFDSRLEGKGLSDDIREAGRQRNNSRNLINGLLEGTAVCSGYSEILRNALSLVGIKSKLVTGKCFNDPDFADRHVWNAVELEENGTKKWYYTDLTWDAGKTLNGKAKNILIGEEEFRRKGHQVIDSYDLPEMSEKDYPRDKVKNAITFAKRRMVNPRKAYVDPEVKPKAKEELEEPEQKEEKPEPKGERVKSEEELADIEKRASCRRQMDDIYRILDTTTRLDPASRKNYYSKLVMLEEKLKELDKKIEAYAKQDVKSEPKKKPKKEPVKTDNKSKDGKEMPGVKINTSDVEFEESDPDFEEIVEDGGVGKLLPVVRTREDLIAYKKQNMLEKAEKGFVGFTNKLFGRNDNKPPRFISGIIKFALNTRFWVQDKIRDIRDRDDKIDEELFSIATVHQEIKDKRSEALLVEKHELTLPPKEDKNRKKTIAEKEAEKAQAKARRKKEREDRLR